MKLFEALRTEPLTALVGEAVWRVIRSVRRSAFRLTGDACRVNFQPIGYYQSQQLVAERESLVAYADAILRGDYPLLGYGRPHLGTNPDWQCDWVSGKSWPLTDSARIRIVRHDGSDVKAPWELSRLQWSPVVAKAYVLTGNRSYREALREVLTDWILRNPMGLGVNWTVAMEAALRAISLCLTMDLLWPFSSDEKPWLDRMTASLWQHLRFIEAHSEFSFLLRSNHYLSNIVGLTTLSAYLQGRGMRGRRQKYARAVNREILLQTYPDGGDREASTGYHVLVAQMFLHSLVVQQRSGVAATPEFTTRLRRMFDWIAALSDEAGKLPHLGDCDNGRVELLMEDIEQSMLPATERHSLRVGSLCGLGSRLLEFPLQPPSVMPDSGIAVLRSGQASLVFCAMPNGLGGKGSHTHCDKLSIVFRLGPDEVFCDSGSRGYTRSAQLRNLDRSTRAHGSLTVDEADQNIVPPGSEFLFKCGNEALVSPISPSESGAIRASHQGYLRIGVEHQRTVQLTGCSLRVLDEVSGEATHLLELRYVLGPEWRAISETTTGETVRCVIAGPRRLSLECVAAHPLSLTIQPAEISREYGTSLPASCILIQTTASLPARLHTTVQWD